MAIQTTSNLSNSVRVQYLDQYAEAAKLMRLYDQLSSPIGDERALIRGSSVQIDFLGDMAPGVNAISETTDITPQTLRDNKVSITPTSRGEAIEWSQALDIQAYTNYGSERFKILGKNQMETVDLLAQAAALQGTLVLRGANVARSALDAGTAAHRLSDTAMVRAETMLQSLRAPHYVMPNGSQRWVAIMHPNVYHDLRQSGNIVNVGNYQQGSIVLNWELGEFGPFKLISTAWAKTFLSAASANATAVSTTVNTAAKALDTTIVTAADVSANITAGETWMVGPAVESANTFQPLNERIRVVSAATTTLTIVGEGANGGLRFDHPVGDLVKNADHAYTVAFGSPASLAKLYAPSVGEFGEVVGPLRDGTLEQFVTLGYKFYGGYGRISESYILRGEYSSSVDA